MQLTATDPAGGPAAWAVSASTLGPGTLTCAGSNECFSFPSGGGSMQWSTDPAVPSSWQDGPGPAFQHATTSCPISTLCVSADPNAGDIQIGVPPVPTATALTAAAGRAVVGQPITVGARVTSSQAGAGTPAGTATVRAGSAACSAKLTGTNGTATGTCKLTEPATGTYHISASYPPQGAFGLSTTATTKALTITKAAAKPRLKLSQTQARYTRQHNVRLTVTVAPQYTGTPGGKVIIMTGSKKTICTLTLTSGRASCLLPARKLAPGTYYLRAHYLGTARFNPAYSPFTRLRILR